MTRPNVVTRRVRSGDAELHVEVWGSGSTPLVLGHGFGGSARNFRPQARELSSNHLVVLFDARGHARSDAPADPAQYEPDRFVTDVLRVIDHVGAERAVVGGLSMGAGIALRIALAHPERVAGLLLSAFPRPASDPGHVAWAHAFADDIERFGVEVAGARHAWGERLERDPRAAELVKRGFLEHQPHALAHVLRRLLAKQPGPEALERELSALELPTLILVGTADATSLGPSRGLAARIAGSRLVEVGGGGHVINLERPAEYNRALAQLLAEVGV